MGDAWDVWGMPGFFVEFELSEISMYGPCMAHAWDVWEDSFQANCFKFSLILRKSKEINVWPAYGYDSYLYLEHWHRYHCI